MYSVQTKFIVRYAETDQMQIVHHSNYPIWYEVGRTDFIKSLGVNLNPAKIRHKDLLELASRREINSARLEGEVIKMGCRWGRDEFDFRKKRRDPFLLGILSGSRFMIIGNEEDLVD